MDMIIYVDDSCIQFRGFSQLYMAIVFEGLHSFQKAIKLYFLSCRHDIFCGILHFSYLKNRLCKMLSAVMLV